MPERGAEPLGEFLGSLTGTYEDFDLDASDAHHAAATRAFEATRIGYGVPVTSFGRCR